ncbi:MAG: ABC transporter permease subunit [Alphaproteobacteria bacterium]
MRNIRVIFQRELGSYFATPVAYVFLVVFLLLAGTLTFFVGNFFGREQADLQPFFVFHPWLYMILVPAIAMRLWAEERKTGTVELLFTLPISLSQAVIGKFLAAWLFAGVALALTFPIWIAVNILGEPDNGALLGGYIGSFLMAGGFIAIGACFSAWTKNQIVAFIVSAAVCLVFTLSGTQFVLGFVSGWLPQGISDTIASLSFLTHFNAIAKGAIDLRDLVFFGSVIVIFLIANTIVLDLEKAE